MYFDVKIILQFQERVYVMYGMHYQEYIFR